MAAKAFSEMLARPLAIALVGEHRAQSLMRGGVVRIGLQGRLIMRTRLSMAVGAKQEIAEVDMRHRVIGMVEDRFRVDAAGGIDCADRGKQRSKFVECAEMGRRAAQNIDKGRLRVLPAVKRAE